MVLSEFKLWSGLRTTVLARFPVFGALWGIGDFPKPQGELVAELEQNQGSHLLSGPVLHTHTLPAGLGTGPLSLLCLLGIQGLVVSS